jgi:hypothetical protein
MIKSNYKRLGDYIKEVKVRNTDLAAKRQSQLHINPMKPLVVNRISCITKQVIAFPKAFPREILSQLRQLSLKGAVIFYRLINQTAFTYSY